MRRTLSVAVLVTLLGVAGCGDDTPAKDVTPESTQATAPSSTATPDPTVGTLPSPNDIAAASGTAAAPTSPDVGDPVLAAYQSALDGLGSILGPEGTTAAIARLDAATPSQAWSPEMLAALFASFCNDWESDDSAGEGVGPLTEQGRADWAAAVAVPLGISQDVARLAIDWALADVDFAPPCQ